MMYAELMGNHKKYRIKSLYDNKFAHVEYGHRQTPGRYVPAIGKRLKKDFVPGKKMLHRAMLQTSKTFKEDAETS